MGGYGNSELSSAELYSSTTETWIATGALKTARYLHSTTLLPNGNILVAGGFDGTENLSTVEIYDPSMGKWTTKNSLITARSGQTATLLPNGNILIAGGGNFGTLSSVELYNSASRTWAKTGTMRTSRANHTATLLPNGKVLVTGGTADGILALASAELYDPAIGMWMATGSLGAGRQNHTATLLPNGKVLIAGGYDNDIFLSGTEIYDPVSGMWTNTGMLNNVRHLHTVTLLPNGNVLVVGGYDGTNILSSVEVYDPASTTWTTNNPLKVARYNHTATFMGDGKILIAGGSGNSGALTNVELYDVGLGYSNSWQPQITSVTSPLNLGGNLVITGSQFRGVSEGSSGNSQDSSADYPLVQLRRLDNEQTVFLLTTNWSTNTFTSLPVWNFPAGYALATVFVNGIQSTSSIVNISVPVPTTATLTGDQALTNGSFQFAFTNNVGALFGVLASTNLALPLTNWTALGGVLETSPGQFQFTDPQATNGGQRFYRLRSP